MRREKRQADWEKKFKQHYLRKKQKRENANPPLGKAANLSLDDGTVAAGAFEQLPVATFLSASEK